MKKILLFLQFLFACSMAQQKIVLVENKKSDYKIIISENASDIDKRAASIFQQYLEKISSVVLPIKTDINIPIEKEIIIGLTNRSNSADFISAQKRLKEDGYYLKTVHDKLFIIGGNERGTIYGVTGFLEDYLGCRKYSPSVEIIPPRNNIILNQINDEQVPPAKIRIINGIFAHDLDYKDWRKLTTVQDKWGDGDFRGYYVHTFNTLVPKEKYFDSHPEYFSLVNGKRIPYGQLCLSNKDVLKITIENLREVINQHPKIKYWSVSQNDTYENCECPECKEIDNEEGSPSGALIRFVNRIAEVFPDKIITTLAYQYTRKPPKITKPLENVLVTLCTIELNRSEPIETDSTSKDFRDDIIGWSKITNNIMLWDYEVQFTNYFCPFPIFHTLQPNIQFFTKYNVIAHFQQCNLAHGVEFAEMKGYYLSKILWNPKADGKTIINDFIQGYYDKAAPYIHEYYDLIHSEAKKSGQRLDIYGTPVWHAGTFLSKKNLIKYNKLFDKAEAVVKNNPEILQRVKNDRLPVLFSEIEIGKTDIFGERGWYNVKNGKYVLKQEMKKKLDTFYETCKKQNIAQMHENNLDPKTYYENTIRFINVETKGNLAFKKPVSCNPLPDKKYFGSGPSLLTNGVKGTEDYKINWLGWEDLDFDIFIDLEKAQKIKEIIVSCLQMTKSWIIFPLKITCFLSDDGINYKEFNSIKPEGNLLINLEIRNLLFSLPNVKTRFIKLSIEGTKKLPSWHNYSGNKSWVFLDEVIVK